jgi:ABC-type glycerol-3-phosphate transport system permease component
MRTGLSTAHSVVEPTPAAKWLAMAVVILYAFVTLVPLGWILLTSIKSPPDSISYPPKVVFEPSMEGYCNLFTTRSRQTEEYIKSLPPAADACDSLARRNSMVVVSRSNYLPRFLNSLIIAGGSTLLSVGLGVMAAYAFSRFKVPGKDDLMFFILSTRMMPPIAVAIPIYLMYRELGLSDTKLGMILLYSAVNVSLAGLAAEGLHRRDPARVRGRGDGRRLHPAAGVPQGGAAAGRDRHRRDRDLLPDLRLERIRVRGAAHQRRGADRAAVHPDHHRRGRPGLARGRRRHDALPGADPGLHRAAAQAPAARHHLRRGAQMNLPVDELATPAVPDAHPRWPRWLRRGPLELAARRDRARHLMMLQPFALELFTWSFVTTLAGVAMFTIVSKFPLS